MKDKKVVKVLKESYLDTLAVQAVLRGDVVDQRALKFAFETLLSYYMLEKDAIEWINEQRQYND